MVHGRDTLGSTRRSHGAHKYDWSIDVAPMEPDPSSYSRRITVRCLVCSLYDDLIGFQSKATVNPFDCHIDPPGILDPVQAPSSLFTGRKIKQTLTIQPCKMGFDVHMHEYEL